MADKRGKAAFFSDEEFNIDTHEVQEVHEDSTTSTTSTNKKSEFSPQIEFGATQGKKGHKSPRINMAFSPENHEWIKSRSRQLGISATEFVNSILEKERKSEEA